MASALISALTKRPVRNDTAMTGEITLRGRVLAIGGLKDKTLAAHRHGIRRLIAPLDNKRDLVKIPANVQKDMEFVWVSNMDEVIAAAIMLDEDQVGGIVNAAEEQPASPAIDPAVRPPAYTPDMVTDARGRPTSPKRVIIAKRKPSTS
jgi:ATP-dependent Lon protease